MKHLFILLSCLILSAGAALAQDRGRAGREVPVIDAMPGGAGSHPVELSAVPPEVLSSARQAVAGVVVTKAEWFNGDDGRVYNLTGGRFQRSYTIWVRSDGKLLHVQSDDRGD
ncbi:MAG: hypothetical protein ACX93N_06975 [Pseudohaliea sp.]